MFCTKNGSYIPWQQFLGNHKDCPRRAARRFSCAFWAVHRQCDNGRGLCRGSVCFVLLWSVATTRHFPLHSHRAAPAGTIWTGWLSAYQPLPSHRGSGSNAQQKTQSPLYPIRNTREQYRKIQISDALGLSALLEGGEEGGTGLTCKGWQSNPIIFLIKFMQVQKHTGSGSHFQCIFKPLKS